MGDRSGAKGFGVTGRCGGGDKKTREEEEQGGRTAASVPLPRNPR